MSLDRDARLIFLTRGLRMFGYGFVSVVLVLYLAARGTARLPDRPAADPDAARRRGHHALAHHARRPRRPAPGAARRLAADGPGRGRLRRFELAAGAGRRGHDRRHQPQRQRDRARSWRSSRRRSPRRSRTAAGPASSPGSTWRARSPRPSGRWPEGPWPALLIAGGPTARRRLPGRDSGLRGSRRAAGAGLQPRLARPSKPPPRRRRRSPEGSASIVRSAPWPGFRRCSRWTRSAAASSSRA